MREDYEPIPLSSDYVPGGTYPAEVCVLRYALEHHARTKPDEIFAAFEGGERWTFAQTLEEVASLAGNLHALGALAGAGVGLGLLTPDRQAATMAQAAVATDLLESLDVLRAFAAQVALDGDVGVDQVAELDHFLLGQVAHLAVGLDAQLRQQLVGRRPADAVDICEADLDPLVEGDVDP